MNLNFALVNTCFCIYELGMNLSTAQTLLKLNKTYYDTAGNFWNNDPLYSWDGWELLLGHITKLILAKGTTITVLDIGAGNGRWFHYLTRKFPEVTWVYTAIDSSDFGRSGYGETDNVTFIHADIFDGQWVQSQYDLVVAFGVLHHVPGKELQHRFLQQFLDSLSENGLGVFTTWQYIRLNRLRKRVLHGEVRAQLCNELGIDEVELTEQDNFLSWVKGVEAVRFSHYFDTKEVCELLSKFPNLTLIERFFADDRTQNRNEYFVVNKQ
jgi:tRNA (uracil-5-)-methyltransferase TRM9